MWKSEWGRGAGAYRRSGGSGVAVGALGGRSRSPPDRRAVALVPSASGYTPSGDPDRYPRPLVSQPNDTSQSVGAERIRADSASPDSAARKHKRILSANS